MSFTIIGYHHVEKFNSFSSKKLYISKETFENEIKLLVEKGVSINNLKDIQNYHFSSTVFNTVLTFDDGYLDFYINAFPILKKYNLDCVLYVISKKVGQVGYCTKEMIKEMYYNRVEIGSHTLSHRKLTTLSKKEQYTEIHESKLFLEEIIGAEINSFCYPYGDFNETTVELVKKSGYHNAVTTITGLNRKESDWFRLNRVASEVDDTSIRFMHKVVHGA